MGLLGDITLTNPGIDGTDTPDDREGKAGEATITVKASDATGRFLTDAPKQTFTLTTVLTRTGDIGELNDGHFEVPPGSGYLKTYTAGAGPDDADNPTRVEVRIDG